MSATAVGLTIQTLADLRDDILFNLIRQHIREHERHDHSALSRTRLNVHCNQPGEAACGDHLQRLRHKRRCRALKSPISIDYIAVAA